jgi:hypothetical protein
MLITIIWTFIWPCYIAPSMDWAIWSAPIWALGMIGFWFLSFTSFGEDRDG